MIVAASQAKQASSRAQAMLTTPAGLRRSSRSLQWQLVEAVLAAPGNRDDAGVDVALATLEDFADARRAAVVPGGFDEQPACVA